MGRRPQRRDAVHRRAVRGNTDHFAIRPRKRGAERARQARSDATSAYLDQLHRRLRRDGHFHVLGVGHTLRKDQRVVWQCLLDLVHQPRSADGRRIPVLAGIGPIPLVHLRDLGFGAFASVVGGLQRGARQAFADQPFELGQARLWIAQQANVGTYVLADFVRVTVQLDEPRRRSDDRLLGLGKDELESWGTNDEQDVAIGQSGANTARRDEVDAAHIERMPRRYVEL